jgi:hypothetical protein
MPIVTFGHMCSVSGEGMGAALQQEASLIFSRMVAHVSLAYPELSLCIHFPETSNAQLSNVIRK